MFHFSFAGRDQKFMLRKNNLSLKLQIPCVVWESNSITRKPLTLVAVCKLIYAFRPILSQVDQTTSYLIVLFNT